MLYNVQCAKINLNLCIIRSQKQQCTRSGLAFVRVTKHPSASTVTGSVFFNAKIHIVFGTEPAVHDSITHVGPQPNKRVSYPSL